MILIFESHPVQYRAPLYRALNRLIPNSFEVIYASDCSIRGFSDREFGKDLKWDIPLLTGYPNSVLGNERGAPLESFGSLHGRGIFTLLRERRPPAVLITTFNFEFGIVALASAFILSIPVWVSTETQDYAGSRGPLKNAFRSITYRCLYSGISHAFYIGELNRQHYHRFGFGKRQLSFVPYSVDNPFAQLSDAEMGKRRETKRRQEEVQKDEIVVSFIGKLIPKKAPELLLDALDLLPSRIGRRICLWYVGSGELEADLRKRAKRSKSVRFHGFVNQSFLPDFYLASDIVILLSRRQGRLGVWLLMRRFTQVVR